MSRNPIIIVMMAYLFSKPLKSESSIYLIPLSSKKETYGIIYPDDFYLNFNNPDYYDNLTVKLYEGCPETGTDSLKKELLSLVEKGVQEYVQKTRNRMILGGGMIAFGILDFILVDPLVLLDEILIILGGMFLFKNGLKLKKDIPVYKKNISVIEKKIRDLTITINPLCTELYKSIIEMENPFHCEGTPDSNSASEDSSWFDHPPDVESLLKNHSSGEADVRNMAEGIQRIIPVKLIKPLEARLYKLNRKRKNTYPVTKKLRALREKIQQDTGLTEDAFAMYYSFYTTAQEYIERSKRL